MKWIDMHCDTLSALLNEERGTLAENNCSVDVRRLRSSGAAAQFFACFVNAAKYSREGGTADRFKKEEADKEIWNRAYEEVLAMLSYARGSENEEFCIASYAKDIPEAESAGKIAGILTVEEGGVLGGELGRLEELYESGVRLITLTWNYANCIGSPNSRNPEIMSRGLTRFGMEAVERMNELGMVIDVSHLSDGGFYDCIRHSAAPIAASHSNARSLCPHPRNLTDEMLHLLGEKGGVAGLNFYSAFLKPGGNAAISDIARHAAYMVDKAGEDAVALGSDLDGFERAEMPAGISGVQDMERLWAELKKAGLTSAQIEKIAYRNAMRMIHEVW